MTIYNRLNLHRYNGFLGGYFNDSRTNAGFTRLVNDESNMFSTRFYYDRLGRLVVSQNTKQFNTPSGSPEGGVTARYSYTKYDVLGRIEEVGEKTENTTGNPQLASIFGTLINGTYNPNAIDDTKLDEWITNTTGLRKEVTKTYYDVQSILSTNVLTQQNLRKRVSGITYEDVNDDNKVTYDHASFFSYDIHGNVKTLIQHNQKLAVSNAALAGQRYKQLDYDYDLISGKVNVVRYQDGEPDAFYHFYEYDADNRITEVFTSKFPQQGKVINERVVRDNSLWDRDAKYFYYPHGPLARVEIGDNQVQGMDYAYTLQGWIKGVNSNLLKAENDIGHDSLSPFGGAGGGLNASFAIDAFGYTLGYYEGDYKPVYADWSDNSNRETRFEASLNDPGYGASDLFTARNDLFNGNISHMVTTITHPEKRDVLPQGTAYKYDQLNRLIEMKAFNNVDRSNAWQNSGGVFVLGGGVNDMYYNKFTYDANGNITSQVRKAEDGTVINDLTYNRFKLGGRTVQNRLYSVNDAVDSGTFDDDIDDQGVFSNVLTANNYGYTEIGELKRNTQKEIAEIKYTVYGKVKEVIRTEGSAKKNLKFDYDANQNRIAKHVYSSAGDFEKSEFYLRDATGNVMSIYTFTTVVIDEIPASSYAQTGRHIYGSSRLGIDKTFIEMVDAVPTNTVSSVRVLGLKSYELSNHLGNVLTTVSDIKIPIDNNTDGTIDYFIADIISAQDYYAFGAIMPGRNFNGSSTRYQFNGKEFDTETETTNQGARNEDGDLGIEEAMDENNGIYPCLSPYNSKGNDPINGLDLDGKLIIFINGFWEGTAHDHDTHLQLETYWDEELRANAAKTLGDKQAFYYNGSQGLGNESTESRQKAGAHMGYVEALKIRMQLDEQKKDDPKAKLNFISHSMGGAYAIGMINALSDVTYPPDGPHAGEKMFSPSDFGESIFLAPYDPSKLKAPAITTNSQFSHTNDAVAGYNKIAGISTSNFSAEQYKYQTVSGAFAAAYLGMGGILPHTNDKFANVFRKPGDKKKDKHENKGGESHQSVRYLR